MDIVYFVEFVKGTVVPLPVFSVVEMCSGIILHCFYIPDFFRYD